MATVAEGLSHNSSVNCILLLTISFHIHVPFYCYRHPCPTAAVAFLSPGPLREGKGPVGPPPSASESADPGRCRMVASLLPGYSCLLYFPLILLLLFVLGQAYLNFRLTRRPAPPGRRFSTLARPGRFNYHVIVVHFLFESLRPPIIVPT